MNPVAPKTINLHTQRAISAARDPLLPTPIHPVDEVLPAPRMVALGLQHVLVMYANAVAVPLILGGALHLPKDQLVKAFEGHNCINCNLYTSVFEPVLSSDCRKKLHQQRDM